jgi:hypothetical protein
MKTVQIIGHQFDGAPSHLLVEGRGTGRSLKAATRDAVSKMFADPQLRWKHIDSFKMTAVVICDKKGTEQ